MGDKRISRRQKHDDLILNPSEFLLLYYRNHPCAAARDLLGLDLNWLQRLALRDIWFRQHIMMVWGRGVSKTFCIAVAATLFGMLYPGIGVGVFGPSLRQATFIFDEMRRFEQDSPYFKASVDGKVAIMPQRCIVKFHNGAFIEALPTGDPGKIRGRRFQVMFLDEYAQIKESTITQVLGPFLAIKKGGKSNKLIKASSAYYKYNHLWPEFIKYSILSQRQPDKYALSVYNYEDVIAASRVYKERGEEPPYEFDLEMVESQKFMMTDNEFAMEWLAQFPNVEEGFIPAHLIDECTPTDLQEVNIEFSGYDEDGRPKADYVLGVDPAWAEGGDNCAFDVGKLRGSKVQVVNSHTLNGASLPRIANTIFKYAERFPVVRMKMDISMAGAGGAIADLMSRPFVDLDGDKVYDPIVAVDAEFPPDNARRLLVPVRPSASENHLMANAVKRRMEKRPALLEFPLSIRRIPNNPILEAAYLEIVALKTEIKVLQAIPKGEYYQFKVPSQYNKDRWSALCLMVSAADDLQLGPIVTQHSLGVGFWVE